MTRGEHLERWSRREVQRLTRWGRRKRRLIQLGLVLYLVGGTTVVGFSVKRFLDYTPPTSVEQPVKTVNPWTSYCQHYRWMPGCNGEERRGREDAWTRR